MSYQDNLKKIEAFYNQKEKEPIHPKKPFYYVVPMFPYPSGNIHMGHVRNYTISNAVANYKRSKGFNVLHPIGFDAFGLPAENASIKNNINPNEWTENNINKMISDFKSIGFDFDWDAMIKTNQFDYYSFEQEIFKKAWEKNLIYKKEQYVNYDPVDKTVLSNEQVQNGYGWRTGAKIIRKKIPMYFFNMRKYAIELHNDLNNIEKVGVKM